MPTRPLTRRPRSATALALLTAGATALTPLASASAASRGPGASAVSAVSSSPAGDAPAASCEVVMVPMRDGTRLATEVYRPSTPGPHPVVLTRSPYNRVMGSPESACNTPSMKRFAQAGYVALNQDVRGTFRSEGTFRPMVQEASDSYDAIEWAGTRPWSTGKVGMVGGSYVGLTQWQGAVRTPPHLAAMVPHYTASDYHDHWTYVNGAFDLWFAQSWTIGTLGSENYRRQLTARGLSTEEVELLVKRWYTEALDNVLTNWVWHLPLAGFSEFRRIAPWYYQWLAHPTYDRFWATMDLEDRYDRVNVPVLNTGGWYDIFQVGTVRNFQGITRDGGSAAARNNSRLVMWSLAHAPASAVPPTTVGEIDFGPGNTFDLDGASIRFFDHHLKGLANGADTDPPVELFVMVPPDKGLSGSGFWTTAPSYPLPGTQTRTFRLGSGGRANTSAGNGVLLTGRQRDAAASDTFVYDPRNPVPTKGGNLCCAGDVLPPGAFDQSEIEKRGDVLVYTTPPMKEDLPVVGGVEVDLFARTSARDTDFTAKLVDVHPDGYAQNVLDRVVRAGFRRGSKTPPRPVTPGKTYKYTLELGNTALIVPKGHRLRLEISSSNFPHYARNLNTGAADGTLDSARRARQTIVHTDRHPSALRLPVVPTLRQP